MSIDWITVAAQLANFLVLVWLLKRFLYRPILDGIDAREREIAERMSAASRVSEAAEREGAAHRAEIERLREGREHVLEEARRLAEAERDALLADARAQLEREREAQDARRAAEAARHAAELHRDGAEALLALTRKALADLSDETLERRIVVHALARSRELLDPLRRTLGDAAEAVVTTRDPLPAEVREQLAAAIADALPGVESRFRDDPSQAPGLTLRIGSAQLDWTTESYVDSLQSLLHERASARARESARAA